MIYCQKCKSSNPPEAQACTQCGATLLPAESGIFGTARNTPLFERYRLRAERHINIDRQQAIRDLDRAIELAPDKSIPALASHRAQLLLDAPEALLWGIVRSRQILPEAVPAPTTLSASAQNIVVGAVRRGIIYPNEPQTSARNRLAQYYLMEFDLSRLVDPSIDEFEISIKRAQQESAQTDRMLDAMLPAVNALEALIEAGAVQSIGYCPDCKDVVQVLAPVKASSTNHACVNGHKKAKLHGHVLPEEFEQLRAILRERLAAGYKIISPYL